jgi:hypothetical protein
LEMAQGALARSRANGAAKAEAKEKEPAA